MEVSIQNVRGVLLRLAIRNLWFDSKGWSFMRFEGLFQKETRCMNGKLRQTVLSSATLL